MEDQEVASVNTGDPEAALYWAERRVLKIQTKLCQWACADAGRRFDDLFNLVADPAFLLVAWDRVRSNRGARSAGVDRRTASSIALHVGVEDFLDTLRSALKDRSFRPLPLRERMIPKTGRQATPPVAAAHPLGNRSAGLRRRQPSSSATSHRSTTRCSWQDWRPGAALPPA